MTGVGQAARLASTPGGGLLDRRITRAPFNEIPFPMASYTINVNGVSHTVEAEPDMPLLWVLRDLLGLTGTKYGCGIGICQSCAVLVDGEARPSCQSPISGVGEKPVTTIAKVTT